MKRRGVKDTDPYDWEKAPAGDNSAVTPPTQAATPSTLPRHVKHVTTDNNQENIEPTDNKEVCINTNEYSIYIYLPYFFLDTT